MCIVATSAILCALRIAAPAGESGDVRLVGRQLEAAELAQAKTLFEDARARELLVGDHDFTLQWISWDFVGRASVTDDDGLLRVKGSQWSKNEKDYVTIDGVILSATQRAFVFYGTVVTRNDIVNHGRPCEKRGTMNFRRSGQRIHWRLQQMDNCEGDNVADYVDIFLKPEHRPQKKATTSRPPATRK
ncbi:MAG: hypothetical protein JXR83_22980 [Deltaproteobacteria bacterium]|nr:hypothetical protein [Deltaproteobacteria bacterium]